MSTLVNPQLLSNGVIWGDKKSQSLWTQLADDAAVIGDDPKSTQLVITFFQSWAAWADLPIRPVKSFAYGAAQRDGRYQQILLHFQLNGLPIPTIAIGGHMTYLSRFSFSFDGEKAKELLHSSLKDLLQFADSLPITPKLKCHALNLQMRSKLSFTLSHYSPSTT